MSAAKGRLSIVYRVPIAMDLFHRLLRQAHLLKVAAAYYRDEDDLETKVLALEEIIETFTEELFRITEDGIAVGVLENTVPVTPPVIDLCANAFPSALTHAGWQPSPEGAHVFEPSKPNGQEVAP